MKFLLCHILFFSLIFLSAINAENNPTDSKSKEDPRFESQKLDVDLLNLDFLDDGRFMTTYRITSNKGGVVNTLDVNVETRVLKRNDDDDNVDGLFLPIEFRVTSDLDKKDISLNDFKVGVVRGVFYNTGITAQILSYIMKSHDYDLGTFHGADFIDFTFNMASEKMIGNSVEIVFKAQASVAAGMLVGNNIIKVSDTSELFSHINNTTLNPSASGSVGVRISKELLIEIFGKVDYYVLNGEEKNVGVGKEEKLYELDGAFSRTNYGMGIKYMPSKSYNFSLTGQKDIYTTNTELKDPTNKTTYKTESMDTLSTMLTFEVRW